MYLIRGSHDITMDIAECNAGVGSGLDLKGDVVVTHNGLVNAGILGVILGENTGARRYNNITSGVRIFIYDSFLGSLKIKMLY